MCKHGPHTAKGLAAFPRPVVLQKAVIAKIENASG
jgi:hypothetical protein